MTNTPPDPHTDGGQIYRGKDPDGEDDFILDPDLPEDSLFTEEDYYDMYRVAADPLRTKILHALHNHKQLSTSEIAATIDKEANALHYHLRKLQEVALIRNQREPRSGTKEPYSYYRLTSLGEIVLNEGIENGIQKLAAQEHDIHEHYTR